MTHTERGACHAAGLGPEGRPGSQEPTALRVSADPLQKTEPFSSQAVGDTRAGNSRLTCLHKARPTNKGSGTDAAWGGEALQSEPSDASCAQELALFT